MLAEPDAPVLLFETGLPTRHYIQRTDIDFAALERTETTTYCPYKGTTSDYWSARIGDSVRKDIAWSYAYPRPRSADRRARRLLRREGRHLPRRVPVERPRTKFSGDDS